MSHYYFCVVKQYYYLLILSSIFLASSCEQQQEAIHLRGEAQGTTWSVKYWGESAADWKLEVDSILLDFDQSLSVYVPNSTVSKFNSDSTGVSFEEWEDPYFEYMFSLSEQVYKNTQGAFDPTVMPLVNYWGFGFEKINTERDIDSSAIDSLLQLVGFEEIQFKAVTISDEAPDDIEITVEYRFIKEKPGTMLDFNAIAQGYSVDVLAEFLVSKGIENYMVEIGGEVRAEGRNEKGELWKIGIDKPLPNEAGRELQAVIALKNKAIATSGNYRKFYVKNGIKYAHTIDPKTGYPVNHSMLSATVLANDCATADAYATVFMVIGIDQSKEFLMEHEELSLEAYFIWSDEEGEWKTWMSEGLEGLIEEKE